MKKAVFYEEAKRLYVNDGFSVDAIEKMLKKEVSRRTLFTWKTENNWDEQRRKYLNTTKSIQDDILEITRLAIQEAKAQPSAHNIYAVVKAVSALKQLTGITLDEANEKDEKPKTITNDTIANIQKLLGL